MITIFQLLEATITPGQSNRFHTLHEKLGTKDMALVFILVCIHHGHNTKDAISSLRQHKSNKHKLLQCEREDLITCTLGVSPHDKRARLKIYELTPKGTAMVEPWLKTLNALLERTNQSRQQP